MKAQLFFLRTLVRMDFSPYNLLPNTLNLRIDQVIIDDTMTMALRSELLTAVCPSCGQAAKRVHSRYKRKPRDLPVSGQPVCLIIEVRRFFCDNTCCPRKTFAEQLPSLLRSHAQSTLRLQFTLQQLGLALGGKAGARLGNQLGLPGSPDSLLRLVRQAEAPAEPSAKIIGIDDWAYKRRLHYGTLICDLETRRPLDLLPDRSVQTVSPGLSSIPRWKSSAAIVGVSTPPQRRKEPHKRFKWLIAGICSCAA